MFFAEISQSSFHIIQMLNSVANSSEHLLAMSADILITRDSVNNGQVSKAAEIPLGFIVQYFNLSEQNLKGQLQPSMKRTGKTSP